MDSLVNNIDEAEKTFKKAKEAITKGIFRWTKDYNYAVMHFEDASKLFKQCKLYERQIECLKFAIECNKKLNDSWATARNYEAIIDTWITNNPKLDLQVLMNYTRESGQYFKVSDSGHNTLNLYVRVAKYLLKQKKIDLAEQMYREALEETLEMQVNSTRQDIVNNYVELLVEAQRYGEVAKLYMSEMERVQAESEKYPVNQGIISQWVLIVVIMFILQDEPIRANEELQKMIITVKNFHRSSEFTACDQLLNFFEQGNQEKFNETVLRSTVTVLYPPNIVRQLRKVKVRVIKIQPQQKVMNNQEFIQKQSLQNIQQEQVIVQEDAEERYKKELEKQLL